MTTSLFKNKTVKAKLEGYKIPDFESKLSKVKAWYDAYQNKTLHKKSESQCEQAFNQSFFIEILGYKAFPNEVYTIDPKGNVEIGSQKPDAILGYFSKEKRRVIAVVEIKDVNTSLDKSQKREGSLSPVQQAFKYKPQYKECDFVIATNFFEIRLLKDNQLDFENFTLEMLIDPKDDYFQFRKFYYLLNAENFIAQNGETNTRKLLSDIRIEQEKITKDFYSKYNNLRKQLIENILKNNHQVKTRDAFYTLAVQKAQKIIDRLVFICFFEDLGLLPDDKLQEVVLYTEKLGLTFPIWDIMKSFFAAIDHGSAKLGIPDGYNGELFKEDEDLNQLKIDDEICQKFVELGKYDFSEDLSVNILGHIFEQSISDLEDLKTISEKNIEGPEISLTMSKRKRDGIYYTPDYIVEFIVKNSLGKYLEELEQTILTRYKISKNLTDENYYKRLEKAYLEYRDKLRNIKVLDPSCGSGAFLVKVYDYLLAENKRISAILTDISGGKGDLFNVESYIKSLLENNIYGVDLNPESVEITKLSLWLKSARKGEKLITLKNNIKCGNSLVADPNISGEQAFRWDYEFLEIIKNGGFDVIVGNPPWGANIDKESEYLAANYPNSTKRYKDTYKIFVEKALMLLKEKGYLGFIVPNTYLYQPRHIDFKKWLDHFSCWIVNLGENIFENVELPSCITIVQNKKINNPQKVEMDLRNEKRENLINIFSSLKFGIGNVQEEKGYSLTLNDVFELKDAGIQYHRTGVGMAQKGKNDLAERIYSDNQDNVFNIPVFTGSELDKEGYWIAGNARKFLRGDYKSILKENEVVTFNQTFFEKPSKIVWRQTADRISATIIKDQWFGNTIQGAILRPEYAEKVNLFYALAIFNSKYFNYLYREKVKETGKVFPQVKLFYLKALPFVIASNEQQLNLEKKAQLMIDLKNEFQTKLQKILKILQHEFQLPKLNLKLTKFYELDFNNFIKALNIKKLSLESKSGLFDFFESNKQELFKLKIRIDEENRFIDDMVFDIYNLSLKERGDILSLYSSY